MKKILLPLLFITLVLIPSEVMPKNQFGNFVRSTVKANSIKFPNEKKLQEYKELYLDKAKNQSDSGNFLQACLTVRKLINILLKKTNEMTMDEWITSYGRFYREVIDTQNQYKKKFIESRSISIKKEFENIRRDRLSVKNLLKAKQIENINSFISTDGLLSIYAVNDQYSDNSHIAVNTADTNEKLFEELPIPDDSKNPQIKRWSRKYEIKTPKWSPDCEHYAYLLNGALCISSQINKPIIISEIKDVESSNDLSFDWSLDGKNLCYLRKVNNETIAFINNIYDKREKKIGKADYVSISSDGKFAVIENNGKISLYNSNTNKLIEFASGKYPVFSTDDKSIIYVLNNTSINSKQISDRKEYLIFKEQKNKNIVSVVAISANIVAVLFSDETLSLVINDDKTLQLATKVGKIEKSYPNSINSILCENKYIKFK